MRQALELALEALQVATTPLAKDRQEVLRSITAIKEALAQPEKLDQDEVDIRSRLYQRIHELETQLAQPEQEPVAWWIPKAEQFCLPSSDGTRPFAKAWEPLYTTPPQRKWVGLTDEEIKELDLSNYVQVVRIVEAKLKDKNL